MIELDILIEELELSNMSRVSKKYIYENLIEIRQEITKQLTLTAVSHRRELLIATLYGWQDYKDQGISIEDYVEEIESNL